MLVLKFINDNIFVSNGSKTITNSVKNTNKSKSLLKTEENNVNNSDDNSSIINVPEETEDEEFDFNDYMSDEDDESSSFDPRLQDSDSSQYVEESEFIDDTDSIDSIPRILNIDEIMDVRVNNTLALANKDLLKHETANFELLKDFTFDQEIGYIVCSILDSKIRAVSEDNMILSYEYDSNVKQNLLIIDKIIDVYSKITKSNKNIAIISDEKWEQVKNDYISNLKNNIKYHVKEEPDVIFEDLKKDDIITNSAVDLFGDIVEVE